METCGKSRSTFRQALQWDTNVEEVKIPYEGTTLPGHFYHVDNEKRPVLIIHGGYDSTQEELYLEVVVAALEHGYHCLTFEGPDQGAARTRGKNGDVYVGRRCEYDQMSDARL